MPCNTDFYRVIIAGMEAATSPDADTRTDTDQVGGSDLRIAGYRPIRSDPPTPPVPAMCSLAYAAHRLGMGTNTAYVMVREHRFPIPIHMVGTRMRIKVAELDAYLAGFTGGRI